jgi:hypothetical protein
MNVGCELCGEFFLETNIYIKIFSKYFKKFRIDNNKNDMIIRSCLSGNIWNEKKIPYIYWSGENRIPKKSNYETLSISILTTKIANTIYIPFCLESDFIYKSRMYTNRDRDYLIGYCASNPVNIRQNLYNKFIEKIGINKCISFGSCYGNYKETNKQCEGIFQNPGLIKSYSQCKFIFALENSKGDGYVTEKIVNAFVSGAIPIYWGSSNINELFNKDAFINIDDFKNIDECVDYIINMSEDDIYKMLKQPIYTNNDLINIFNDEYNNINDNLVLKEYESIVSKFSQTLSLSL